MKSFKRDVLYAIANKYKYFDQDINITLVEINFRDEYVDIWWTHDFDSEMDDVRTISFPFKDIWKDYKNEKK